MHPATFIWIDDHGTGRNVFVQFRLALRLKSVPAKAELHLFADTRYRLCVNGQVAGYGPARFVPQAPEYDTVDLAPYLKRGSNVVTVEANSFGASSFESVPSIGGFVAWGSLRDQGKKIDLGTPGAWQMRASQAWDAEAPPYSFAQGPVEIVDLRATDGPLAHRPVASAGWQAPIALAQQDHWGQLLPRSIPNLSLYEVLPDRTLVLGPLSEGEERISYRVDGPVDSRGSRTLFATHLYAPSQQDVTLVLFWGPYYLNGREMEPTSRDYIGNRREFRVTLREGWNFLYGAPESLVESWGQLIGWPAGLGIVARAEPRMDAAETLRHTGVISKDEFGKLPPAVPTKLEELPEVSSGWRSQRGPVLGLPAREMAWDTVEEAARKPALPQRVSELEIPLNSHGAGTILVDFGGEYIGHAVVDITAPAGTLIDIANEEKLRKDGLLEWYTHWGVNSADRFIHPGGRITIEAFHPRGGRYMNVTARHAGGPVTLHKLSIRKTLYPVRQEGRFECSDPVLTWAWQAGVDTLVGSMEDAYVDPWRERGVYLGDTLVEAHVTRRFTADERLTRRCLWLWGVGQREDGQIQDVVPSWHAEALPDYTLIWVIMLHDYWAATGDLPLVRQMWPHVERVFESSDWAEADSGLWDATGKHVFVDWGIDGKAKQGENGVLNAFRYAALQRAATMGRLLKNEKAAAAYEREARRVKKAYQTLWDEKAGRFAALRSDGQLKMDIYAGHANSLALLYGLADRKQEQRVLDYVASRLDDTRAFAPARIELYFLYYTLSMLLERGRPSDVERVIRDCWGHMKHSGAWTLWETLDRGNIGVGSKCHGWSAAPTALLMEHTLGVRPAQAGKPNELIFAPQAATVTWARGVYPHAAGGVEVEWTLEAGAVWAKLSVPRGVKVKVSATALVDGQQLPLRADVTRRG